jgi:cytochrome c
MTWGERARNNAFDICASCHGSTGEGGYGPAIIGSNANLNTFGTAQRLLNYIGAQMPQGAPGSLSDLDYLKILAFLLIENSIVQAEAIFDADNLANVPLS